VTDLADFAVNCSILYPGRSTAEALALVRRAGYSAVEFWWPFATATPSDAEVDEFTRAITTSGLDLVALNLFAGDMSAGDRGVLSWPNYEDQFQSSVEVACRIQEATGCGVFNALYGRRRDGVSHKVHRECAVANLEHACSKVAAGGGTVVLEPLSGAPDYPLKTADQVMEVLDAVRPRTPNIGMLLDVYHLWTNGDDVASAIARCHSSVAHVQLADAPGRGAPGSGDLPLLGWVDDLRSRGYSGRIALEFVSQAEDPLAGLQLRSVG
jgi:hydroxypyruvate isomerase